MHKMFVLLSLAALVFSAPVFAADVSGKWQLDMTNQMGAAEKWDLDVKADNNNNLTIDVTHPNFGKVSGKGTLKGDKITMNFSLPGGIGPVIIDFEGMIKGNKMSGTRKVSYGPATGGGAKSSAPAGGAAPIGSAPAGGPASAGGAPAGGQGGPAPAGGTPTGGAPAGAPPAGGQGGGAPGGAPAGGGQAKVISDAWTAVKK
jgi:hypothetical protein